LKGAENYQAAKMFLKPGKEIKTGIVSSFIESFKACYNSYIQLNKLELETIG
jgi:hypothetical protein